MTTRSRSWRTAYYDYTYYGADREDVVTGRKRRKTTDGTG